MGELDLIFNDAERVRRLTPESTLPRGEDGRPRVGDELLDRLRLVTNEEAWEVIGRHSGYPFQFAGGWEQLHPGQVLVGRAVTARFVPRRPDLHQAVDDAGVADGWPAGRQNTWVIDQLQPGDVLVVDLFGKVRDGTVIGDRLGTAIASRTRGGGLVVDGGIRDSLRMVDIEGLQVFHRGVDPSAIAEVTLVEVNGPVQVGGAVVMPGDAVLGTRQGVSFIPPDLLETVVEASERTRSRDVFGKVRLTAGVYTTGQIDTHPWEDDIEADYLRWAETEGA